MGSITELEDMFMSELMDFINSYEMYRDNAENGWDPETHAQSLKNLEQGVKEIAQTHLNRLP